MSRETQLVEIFAKLLVADDRALGQIHRALHTTPPTREVPHELHPYFTPLRERTNVEQLMREQNYQQPDPERVKEAIAQLNLTEPSLEKLLEMLKS